MLQVVSYNAAQTSARQAGLGGCGCGTGGARYGLADATPTLDGFNDYPLDLVEPAETWRWIAFALGAGAFFLAFKD